MISSMQYYMAIINAGIGHHPCKYIYIMQVLIINDDHVNAILHGYNADIDHHQCNDLINAIVHGYNAGIDHCQCNDLINVMLPGYMPVLIHHQCNGLINAILHGYMQILFTISAMIASMQYYMAICRYCSPSVQ